MTKGGRALVALGGAVLALAVYWALSPSGKPDPAEEKKPEATSQAMEGIRLEGVGSDGARWTLTADRAQTDAGGELGQLTGVKFVYTSKDGVTTGDAARAEHRDASSAYHFAGGVTLARGEWTAKTESADYDPVRGIVTGGEAVKIASEGIEITGLGFEVDMNRSLARILAASHAVIAPGKGVAR